MPPYVIQSDGSVLQGESIGPDQLAWEYHPSDLRFIRIDHQSRIQVEGFEFVIGLPFTLKSDGVDTRALDPAERADSDHFWPSTQTRLRRCPSIVRGP